jgi:hypothetical protein
MIHCFEEEVMNYKALVSQWIAPLLIVLLLAACSAPQSQSALTPILPTSTLLPPATATVIAPPPTMKAPSAPTLTVKFTEKDCTYEGPQSIPYGKFTVNWIVDDPKHNKTALVFLTLARGKTIDDLRACACTEVDATDWLQGLWLAQENAFGAELKKTRTYTYEYDLRDQASYHGEPLYMFCGNEEGKTSSLGPIEVTK